MGTNGHSDSTSRQRSAWHPERRQRDEQPPLDAGAMGGVCGCCWVQVLEHHDPVPKAPTWHPISNRTLQAGTGTDLGEGSADSVMENLNWGYIQLGMVALAFGGLQVWWISRIFSRRDLAKPLTEKDFRRSLEQIWAKDRQR
jgi:hypothetical protein